MNPPKGSGDGHCKASGYYDKKDYDKHGHGSYLARAANVWTEPDNYESDSLSDVESDFDVSDAQQDRSYHIGVTEMADEVEGFFRKPSLKAALKSKNNQQGHQNDKKHLNQTGGIGMKGGHIPKVGTGKALPAPANN